MLPAAMPALMAPGFMNPAPGISTSSPAMIEVECVAPQSLITYLEVDVSQPNG